MSPQISTAFQRALFMGLIAAAFVGVAELASWEQYRWVAAILGAFLTRFVAEGGYDNHRADTNHVHKADVGSHLTPTQRQYRVDKHNGVK